MVWEAGGGSSYIDNLIEASTIAGNSSFPAPNGETETGHSGNGYARITCIESVDSEGESIENIENEPQQNTVNETEQDTGNENGTITNMKSGDIEISANVSLTGNIDYTKTSYIFTTNSSQLGTSDVSKYSDGKIGDENSTVKKAKPQGTYYLHVLLVSKAGTKKEIISSTTATSQGKKNFSYTGSSQNITLPEGEYQLEVWGAQGGYRSSSDYGGKGGYSTGKLKLTDSSTTLNIYVGGSGNTGGTSGGFNGGGSRPTYNGGGGASDIRIKNTSLYSRVIVAGGGGSCGATSKNGLYGGGTSGGSASQSYGSGGGGGTQTSGGTGGNSNPGTFGKGGAGLNRSNGYAGAGGRRLVWWRPEVIRTDQAMTIEAAGGGSGWIYTESSYNTWKSGNSTDANKYELNSKYYLTEASTIAGNSSFPSTSGGSETGHSGNGYARITCTSSIGSNGISNNNDNDNQENIEQIGEIKNFDYTGSVQSIELTPGRYKLEVWGAQGGSSYGGKGGYSIGEYNINTNTIVYVAVGGKGKFLDKVESDIDGGFNGGGGAHCCSSYGVCASGGGASHISLRNGILSSHSSYKADLLLVAGAGGGGGTWNSYSGNGGIGGGSSGGNGTAPISQAGTGATQSSGGTAGTGNYTPTNPNGYFGGGGNGQGYGNGKSTTTGHAGGGGGGGFYGGGRRRPHSCRRRRRLWLYKYNKINIRLNNRRKLIISSSKRWKRNRTFRRWICKDNKIKLSHLREDDINLNNKGGINFEGKGFTNNYYCICFHNDICNNKNK